LLSPYYRNPHVSRDAGRQIFPRFFNRFLTYTSPVLSKDFFFLSLPDRFPRPISPNLNFAGFDSSQKKGRREKVKRIGKKSWKMVNSVVTSYVATSIIFLGTGILLISVAAIWQKELMDKPTMESVARYLLLKKAPLSGKLHLHSTLPKI